MHTRAIAVAMIAATLWTTPVEAQSLDFKGVPWGASPEAFLQAFPKASYAACNYKNKKEKSFTCFVFGVTYANQYPKLLSVKFRDRGLFEVLMIIEPEQAEPIRQALVDKYGPPTKLKAPPMQSAMGVKVTGLSAFWQFKGGDTISLEKYNDRIDEGYLSLSSPAREAELMDKVNALPKKDI